MQYHCQCACIVVAVVVAAAKLLIPLVASRERRNGILPFRNQAEDVGFRVSLQSTEVPTNSTTWNSSSGSKY